MANTYRAEGVFGDVAELDDTDRRRWSGKAFIASDDLQKESYLGEIQMQGIMRMLGGGESQGPQTWFHRKPAMTFAGGAGEHALIASAGNYVGLNSKFQFAAFFNEATSGWDDIPFPDDGASVYFVQVFGIEVPTDIEVGRDGVIRYSTFKRVVGFTRMAQGVGNNNNNLEMVPGVDAVSQPTASTLELDITTQVGGAWAAAGGGSRQRPIICWKQNAAEQDGNLGAASSDPLVAIYQGVAESDGANVTVTITNTLGQGTSPSLDIGDYNVAVLGPLVDFLVFSQLDTLIFATFDAAAATFDFNVNPCGPTLKAFAGMWTPVPLSPVGGHVIWDIVAPGTAGWSFDVGNHRFRTQGGVLQRRILFELVPWPLGDVAGTGHKLIARKARIRASSSSTGNFTEVTIRRRDLNGATLNMDSGAPRQFDDTLLELTVDLDADNTLSFDGSATGPDSHSISIFVIANGDDATTYLFEGVDIYWELCDE